MGCTWEKKICSVLSRKIAPSLIIGYSVSTVEEAQKAEKKEQIIWDQEHFSTSTKKMLGSQWFRKITKIKKAVHIRWWTIGVINLSHLEEVLATGGMEWQ
jgi:thiamine monophosphate synthase